MTILLGARNDSALVLGADSQESSHAVTQVTRKLVIPQPGLVIAWAGYKDVAQALVVSFEDEPIDLDQPRGLIAETIENRARTVRSNPAVEHRTDASEFLVGWSSPRHGKPIGLRLGLAGGIEWIERWKYAGNRHAIAAAATAQSCVNYLRTESLGSEQLATVALKVLRDSIAVAPPAALVGGEPRLAMITAEGASILEGDDLRRANDTLDLWEAQCAELLPGAATAPSDEGTTDPGLSPPR